MYLGVPHSQDVTAYQERLRGAYMWDLMLDGKSKMGLVYVVGYQMNLELHRTSHNIRHQACSNV